MFFSLKNCKTLFLLATSPAKFKKLVIFVTFGAEQENRKICHVTVLCTSHYCDLIIMGPAYEIIMAPSKTNVIVTSRSSHVMFTHYEEDGAKQNGEVVFHNSM
jgi:hypothetical protein